MGNTTLEKVRSEALNLPEAERAELAEFRRRMRARLKRP
jgi:hypothetical protein